MQLTATLLTNITIHLHQAILNHLTGMHPVLHQIRQLQKLAQPNHLITNKNRLNTHTHHSTAPTPPHSV